MPVQPTKIHFFSRFPASILFVLLFISSCTVVRKYQPYKPFVFENKINISGKLPIDEKSYLKDNLVSQIEDSVKPQIKDILFIRHVMNRPPAFDSNYVKQSTVNMRNRLVTSGYFRGMVTADWSKVDTIVKNGKKWHL